jgi:dihydroorotase
VLPNKSSIQEVDILIENGIIKEVGRGLSANKAEIIKGKGKFVFPGFIDLHVHLREPGREDEETIRSGSKAAARGGFVGIACMPNTDPPLDNPTEIAGVLEEARRVGLVEVYPIATITKGRQGKVLSEMGRLLKAGAVAFSDDGNGVAIPKLMRRALEYAKSFNALLILHEEDPSLSQGGQVNEGFYSTLLGLKGLPGLAEEVMVARDLLLAEELGARIHITHVSTRRSLELIREAKKKEVKVTCDVTPHHLILNHEGLVSFDTNLKVKPPLRSQEDIEALREGLKDGLVDAIASDHAPHAWEEKTVEFEEAAFGIVGLETTAQLIYTELVEKKIITLNQMAEKLSLNPALILGVDLPKIEKGAFANLVVYDPNAETIINPEHFQSKSRNTPFAGRAVKGQVSYVFSKGQLIVKDGSLVEGGEA